MKPPTDIDPTPDASRLAEFVALVVAHGAELYRDHPWRRTRDPYAVLLSEVMLQQTQVSRVEPRWGAWLEEFPTIDSLAGAPLEPVLVAWQGLGYNRRAIALKRAAEETVMRFGGVLPSDAAELRSLPGIGPATAAGVRAFAFDLPGVYLETNVRTVVLHELFPDRDDVSDREIVPVLESAVEEAARQGVSPRTWYYALLDYGAWLKREMPNPSRRSAHHTRQSRFEGSRRQKRAWLLRAVIADPGATTGELGDALARIERDAGRDAPGPEESLSVLEDLARDGFVVRDGDGWFVA